MTYIEVNGTQYPATVKGKMVDPEWDGRASKTIMLEMSYADAMALFVDDLAWSIVLQDETEIDPETGEEITPEPEVYDNGDYCIAGAITDNRNGYVSVKMGKKTNVEVMQEQLANAVTEEELTNAYTEGVNSL